MATAGGASVGGFNPVDIDVAVCEYGTSYGRYAYGLVFEAELFCDFSHKFMYYTVAASRAVVHGLFGQERRARVYSVFFLYDIVEFHMSVLWEMVEECVEDFLWVGDDSAEASEVVYGH